MPVAIELRFEPDRVAHLDFTALQDDREDAALAEDLLAQSGYESVHFLARLAVPRYFQSNVIFVVSDEKDMALTGSRQVHPGYGDVFFDLARLKSVVVKGFLVHHQDLPKVPRVAAPVAFQSLGGYGARGVHRVGGRAFNAGDVKIDDSSRIAWYDSCRRVTSGLIAVSEL